MEIGPYTVEEEVARGGMGVVYRARETRTGEQVAVKVLLGVSAAQRARFEREVRSLTRLRHPNVVRVLATGEARGQPWLAMELLDGASLGDEVRRLGPLDPDEAAEVVATLADALAHCHALGVLHRDLKPDNVLRTREGRIVLTDFGLALELEGSLSRLSQTGILLGTPGYWPPEQARGELGEIGPRSDVYGLGAVLYALLTGDPPVEGASLAEIAARTESHVIDPPRKRRAEVPGWLDAVCLRALAKAPADRFGEMRGLAEALRQEPHSTAPPRLGRWLVLAGAATLGLGAIPFTLSRRDPGTSPAPTPTVSSISGAAPVFAEAERLRSSGSITEAIAAYRRAASLGFAPAMNRLGVIYGAGEGVPRDRATSVKWYRAAVALGDSEALNNLGNLYAFGDGVERDMSKAIELYRRSARLGNPSAMTNMGSAHMTGQVVPRDVREARRWYELASERGEGQAMLNLGLMEAQGLGGQEDPRKAFSWFERAAAEGIAAAYYELGISYRDGAGATRDLGQATTWFKKGAEAGHVQSMTEYARALMGETGATRPVPPQALSWLRRAARTGNTRALFNLGLVHHRAAHGRPAGASGPNDAEMLASYRAAATKGHPSAVHALGQLHESGLGVERDLGLALRYYQTAVRQEAPRARKDLDRLLRQHPELNRAGR